MASSNSRRSSCSNADSGISCQTTAKTVNPRYACYWTDNCKGKHELDSCRIRPNELRGKLGIYYSPNGIYKRFGRDQINNLPLENNPTGCTMISLLIYKNENNEPWLLFVTKLVKEKQPDDGERTVRQLLLALPSSNPRKKNEDLKNVAARALESITNTSEINKDLRSRFKRFLFVDANATYPLYLNNEQANLLTTQFSSNEEVTSLHWYPLSTVLSKLPEWNDYLSRQAEGNELEQVRHPTRVGIQLNNDDENSKIWSVTTSSLMCIRNHVGFEEFLKP
jgi:hypothetical protein